MIDYTFFAMLFYVVSSLAPGATSELRLQNSRYAEQTLIWTHEADGRWAMTINGREMGHFERASDAVLHHTGIRETDRYAFQELTGAITPRSARIELRGSFAPSVLEVVRSAGQPPQLVDRARNVLMVPLIVHSR